MSNEQKSSVFKCFCYPDELGPAVLMVFSQIMVGLYFFALAVGFATADGLKDMYGTPLGADFLNVYAAGLTANLGHADQVYDKFLHRDVERAIAGYIMPYCGWYYPPLFLFVARLTAFMPYLLALWAYLGAGFAGYWVVIRRIAPRSQAFLWAIAAFPGVFTNIANGQNGFLTTTLFGGGLLLLEDSPWLAGGLFGLLAYKPQFFVIIPLILAVGGYWRAALASLLSAAFAVGISWAVFGTATWQAFFSIAGGAQRFLLEQGAPGWEKIQSLFSLVRMWGGSVTVAYLIQSVVAGVALLVAAWLWHRKASLALRASALCGAALLTTPYMLDYDLVILAVPIAFLAKQSEEKSFRLYEKLLLVALWVLPLIARSVGQHHILLTPFLLIALMGITACRAAAAPPSECV